MVPHQPNGAARVRVYNKVGDCFETKNAVTKSYFFAKQFRGALVGILRCREVSVVPDGKVWLCRVPLRSS